MKVKINRLIIGCLSLAVVFDILFLIAKHVQWLLVIFGIPTALLLPGLLIVLLLGARKLELKALLIACGLSVLELMLIGLTANYLPEIFGAKRPLDTAAIPILFNLLIIVPLAFLFIQRRNIKEIIIPKIKMNNYDALFVTASVVMLLFSVFGTFRLDNGGSNILSMLCLAIGLLLILFVALFNKKLNTFTYVFVIFSIGLSVLLLTSLRSWNITGTDIKQEYMVYTLTAQHGKWSIDFYKNAYNACLSITILPVALTKLFHVSGIFIFKFIFQLLFATCPLVIFVFVRDKLGKVLAFFAATIFITFPTFTTDSPMLTRQEVAFLFFSLLVMVWFSHKEAWLKKRWKAVFILMSAGVVLSHYSSTYMYVTMLVLVYLISSIYRALRPSKERDDFKISLVMVLVIFLGAFLWYAQATQTSKGLTGTVKNSFSNLGNLLSQDNRGTTVNYTLFGFSASKNQQFNQFITQTKSNNSIQTNEVINSITFATNGIPASPVEKTIDKHIPVSISGTVNKLYYDIGSRLYQVVVLIGVLALLFNKKFRKFCNVSFEFAILCVAGVLILALEVVLPNISLDYGLMRAFQQALFFFLLPSIAMVFIVGRVISKRLGVVAVGSVALFFAIIFTDFLPQLTGGVPASLNLNNSGPYYGAHYTFKSDLVAFNWADENIPHSATVHAADFSSAFAYDPQYPFDSEGILPFQVGPSDYILLQQYQSINGIVYIDVAHNLIPVILKKSTYQGRNLIYANNGDRLYQ